MQAVLDVPGAAVRSPITEVSALNCVLPDISVLVIPDADRYALRAQECPLVRAAVGIPRSIRRRPGK